MSLNDFRVLEKLGSGSFATVYKVVRKSDNRTYALKRVKISQMGQREIADTLNEVRFLASFKHDNIVGFYEAFLEANGRELCIVMEYCGSGDLLALVEKHKRARTPISEEVIWKHLASLVSAVDCLHSRGIVHRDIKCANIFLAEDGNVKLGDLNVSKKVKHGYLHTQIGTPYYMSPEIWANKPYDAASDIWALGCTIYELCTFRPPFQGTNIASLRRAVLAGRFAPIPRTYSRRLSEVITMMLRLQPNARPTAVNLLKLPEISSRLTMTADVGSKELMTTIRVPHELRRLNSNLPKPQYPTLPSKPKAAAPDPATSAPTAAAAAGGGGGGGGTNDENAQPNIAPQAAVAAKPANVVKPVQPVGDRPQRGIAFGQHRKVVASAAAPPRVAAGGMAPNPPPAGRPSRPLGYYPGMAPKRPGVPVKPKVAIPRPPPRAFSRA